MLDEIRRNLIEPLVGGDDLIVLPEELIEQRRLVRIEFGLLDLRRDPVVQIGSDDAQLLATVLIDQLDGCAVLLRAFEVVPRNVVAEDALGDLVLLEEWCSREPDKGRVRQRQTHVAREPSGLGTVRLIRDHDDIVTIAVGFLRVHILIEFVDQAKDVAVVLLEQPFEVGARCRPWRAAVSDATADEGSIDLVVEIVAIGHQQEGEISRQLPAHLFGEEGHGIGLAAALRVPEHAEPAEIRVRPLDDVHRAFRDKGRQCRLGSVGPSRRFRSAIARCSSGSLTTRCWRRFSGGNSRLSSS